LSREALTRAIGLRPFFGKPNSYRFQRVFGELQLEGFEISHTKDGFKWNEHEEIFLQFLKEKLDAEPLPLLEEAEEHRVRAAQKELKQAAEIATSRTAEVILREVPPILERQIDTPPDTQNPPELLPKTVTASKRVIDVELHGQKWRIILELSDDPAIGDWISVGDKSEADTSTSRHQLRQVAVRLSLAHPFMERFAGTDYTQLEPLLRVAAGLGLAETAARDSGVRMASTIRRNLNELLRSALSKP